MKEYSSELRRTPNGRLEVLIEWRKNLVILHLRGDVDKEGAMLLETLFKESQNRRAEKVILNTSRVESICSTGLSVLLTNNSLSLLRGPKLLIARLSDSLHWALEQLGVLSAFRIFDDIDSAVDSIE